MSKIFFHNIFTGINTKKIFEDAKKPIQTTDSIMGEPNLKPNLGKASDFFDNLQLAVTTALRLADLSTTRPGEEIKRSRRLQRRISDLSVNNLPEITLGQVSYHDQYDDCWIILYDRVYDVTEFLEEHPGGADVLLEYAGRDATLAYRGFGHSAQAWQILQKYLIGVLPEEERTGIFKEEKLIGRNQQLRAVSS